MASNRARDLLLSRPVRRAIPRLATPMPSRTRNRAHAGGPPPPAASRAAVPLALLLLTLPSSATAVVVSGGGSARTDCLAVFETAANVPRRNPRHVRCTDGAPCDADGEINGRCDIPVAVCANSGFHPRCALRGVEAIAVRHAEDNGDPRFDPDFQALQARIDAAIEPGEAAEVCATPAIVQVRVRGPLARSRCRSSRKTVELTAVSVPLAGRIHVDKDRLRLTCDPAPAGCDAHVFFAGTFDRIQRQIFNESCAVSGCHDSQSGAAELLLEPGAAYANLVNAPPSNAAAAAAGWRRVAVPAPDAGDPATSFLLHKLTGDLAPGFGARMPLGRGRLDRALVDVVARWIAAGAPADGWVAGTD
jgi:hypothetical protein